MSSVPRDSREVTSSPVDLLLPRLYRVKQRGRDRWAASCPCPDHERGDRSRGLSIREFADGKVAVYCHAFPDVHDAYAVVAAVGLSIQDLFPRTLECAYLRPVRPKPRPVPRSVAEVLLESARFPEAWEIAKTLAPLEPAQARRDVLESWDVISDNGGVPAVMQLYALLRGVALFRYAEPSRAHEPAERQRAVSRLVEELSR